MMALRPHDSLKGGVKSASDGMYSGRDVRNLANLSQTGSTSRVLNLAQVFLTSANEKDYQFKPFFRDSQLNKCILIKHTLRSHEREWFARDKRSATKLLLPFDPKDLKLGGRSIFIGQTGFDAFAKAFFNTTDVNSVKDVAVLRLLDRLPSLDPFLVREHLARYGFRPGAPYLKISPHDVLHMIGFANEEIGRLVSTAFGDVLSGDAGMKLASKILSNELDAELAPLKMTLRMSDAEFSDGIFSWRGFLYFKWRHTALQNEMRQVLDGLSSYQPEGPIDETTLTYLKDVRPRLARCIANAIAQVGHTLDIYDRAYHSLIKGRDPGPFRNFLLDGPHLFFELGENVGILSHISSFWAYRMGGLKAQARLNAADYVDILLDFEESLVVVPPVQDVMI